jgi:hypothetical protein
MLVDVDYGLSDCLSDNNDLGLDRTLLENICKM